MNPMTVRGYGWRACKGPHWNNTSGFSATGHRLLLLSDPVAEKTESGILLAPKTVDQERNASVMATVVEIGWDAWADKSADYCDVGDRVLVGQYTGKLVKSDADGKEYRFISDLDIITPVVSA